MLNSPSDHVSSVNGLSVVSGKNGSAVEMVDSCSAKQKITCRVLQVSCFFVFFFLLTLPYWVVYDVLFLCVPAHSEQCDTFLFSLMFGLDFKETMLMFSQSGDLFTLHPPDLSFCLTDWFILSAWHRAVNVYTSADLPLFFFTFCSLSHN